MRVRRKLKVPQWDRYRSYLNFVLTDGTTIVTLEHDVPLARMLKSMTVKVGGVEHYRIGYPRLNDAWANFKEDTVGTMPQEVLVPVGLVHRVWKQPKPLVPRERIIDNAIQDRVG